MQSLSAFLLFLGDKKIAFKSSLELHFFYALIINIFLFQIRIPEKILTKAVVDVSRGAGEGFS